MLRDGTKNEKKISHWADLMSLITPLKPFKRKHKISLKKRKKNKKIKHKFK
jgi:hypothetical protein